jgi:hypothetical protein
VLLRPAFAKQLYVVCNHCCRSNDTHRAGVTSIIRACHYTTLLGKFHSSAFKLNRLSALWAQAVLRLFSASRCMGCQS